MTTERPRKRDLRAHAPEMLTLGVGAAGGLACTTLQMPGGAMSGAVVAVATLSAFGRAAPISKPLQVLALAVMGVAIGSVVGPDTFANIAAYPVSIALMTLCVLMMTAASALAWRAVGWTGAMALLASVPGSMSYIVSASMELGADAAKVAVAQMSRVIFLVTLLPFIATWQAGGRSAAVALPVYDSPGVVTLCLVAGLAAGWLLVRMKVTGTVLIGALLASAALHFTGVAPGRAPPSVLIVGQILLGTWVGSRFVGFDWALFARICLGTALAVGSAVAVSIGFAWTASRLFDAPFDATLIAYAPGGQDAMMVLALALNIDPIFVSAHHLARYFLINATLPFVIARMRRAESARTFNPGEA